MREDCQLSIMDVSLLHPTLPTTIFSKLFRDNHHKNVQISTADGTEVLAHSAVLASVTGKFQPLFGRSSYGVYKLNTPGITARQWDILLELIHTGKVESLPSGFNMMRLREVCETLDMAILVDFLKEQEEIQGNHEKEHDVTGRKSGLMTLGDDIQGESWEEDGRSVVEHTVDVDEIRENKRKEEGIKSWISDTSAMVTSSQNVLGQVPDSDIEDNDIYYEEDAMVGTNDGQDAKEECKPDRKSLTKDVTNIMTRKKRQQRKCQDISNMDLDCFKCSHSSDSIHEAAKHMLMIHKLSKCYICKNCKAGFTSNSLLDMHVQTNCMALKSETTKNEAKGSKDINASVKRCRICDHVSKSVKDAGIHLNKYHGIKNCYTCRKCTSAFEEYSMYVKHFQRTCGKKVRARKLIRDYIDLNCHICSKGFTTPKEVACHLKTVHSVWKAYICNSCGLGFKAYNRLYYHCMRYCEKRNPAKSATKVKQSGQMQTRKMLKRKAADSLIRKYNTRTKEKKETKAAPQSKSPTMDTQCYICGVKHRYMWETAKHMRKDHGMSNGYICRYCKEGFRTYNNLYFHLKDCTQEKAKSKYRDSKVTEIKSTLKVSVNLGQPVESDFMQLNCPLCKVRQSTKGKAANHMKTVHGQDLCYICKYCGDRFKDDQSLIYHGVTCKIESPTSQAKSRGGRPWKYDIQHMNCHICSHRSCNGKMAAGHLREAHGLRKCYVCKFCSHGYLRRSALQYHAMSNCEKSHLVTKRGSSKKLWSLPTATGVKKSSHGSIKGSRYITRKTKHDFMDKTCGMCGNRSGTFTQAAEHMKTSHGQDLCFICKYCGSRHKSLSALTGHGLKFCKKIPHPVNKSTADSFESSSVKSFDERSEVSEVSSRMDERDFGQAQGRQMKKRRGRPPSSDHYMELACPLCGFRSLTTARAAKHMKEVHNTKKCYTCKNCGEAFTSLPVLKYHVTELCHKVQGRTQKISFREILANQSKADRNRMQSESSEARDQEAGPSAMNLFSSFVPQETGGENDYEDEASEPEAGDLENAVPVKLEIDRDGEGTRLLVPGSSPSMAGLQVITSIHAGVEAHHQLNLPQSNPDDNAHLHHSFDGPTPERISSPVIGTGQNSEADLPSVDISSDNGGDSLVVKIERCQTVTDSSLSEEDVNEGIQLGTQSIPQSTISKPLKMQEAPRSTAPNTSQLQDVLIDPQPIFVKRQDESGSTADQLKVESDSTERGSDFEADKDEQGSLNVESGLESGAQNIELLGSLGSGPQGVKPGFASASISQNIESNSVNEQMRQGRESSQDFGSYIGGGDNQNMMKSDGGKVLVGVEDSGEDTHDSDDEGASQNDEEDCVILDEDANEDCQIVEDEDDDCMMID